MNVDRNAPIDEAHTISMQLTQMIRDAFEEAHRRVAVWEPAPCPAAVLQSLSTVV